MTQETELMSKLLRLGDDWNIIHIDVDEPSERIDVIVSHKKQRRRWFGLASPKNLEPTATLQHLQLVGMRTYLHVPESQMIDASQTWAVADSPLTRNMEDFVIEALRNCHSIHAVTKLTQLTTAEVKTVSERSGVIPKNYTSASPTQKQDILTATPDSDITQLNRDLARSFELDQPTDLPAETDDTWERLIDGDIPISSDSVALQMLLQRIRLRIASSPTEVTRLASIKLLKQYLVKNQSQHQDEINMLRSGGVSMPPPEEQPSTTKISKLPNINDSCWQHIIDGLVKITTDNVGLQMMMERIRLSVEATPPGSSNRIAGARMLYQFFGKHHKVLQKEIAQISSTITTTTSTDNEISVAIQPLLPPPVSAPIWQKLIDGQLEVKTDAVALKMMLESIRISIETNPSDQSRITGAKMLRQYFLKHKSKHQSELEQLLVA